VNAATHYHMLLLRRHWTIESRLCTASLANQIFCKVPTRGHLTIHQSSGWGSNSARYW